MSLHMPGKLVVQVRNGRNGAFSVGDLITSVGNFKVKDQFLDQFAEGEYEGEFVVSSIYPSCYTYRGSITTEIRAKVMDFILKTADEKPVVLEAEPDPIDQQTVSNDAIPAKADTPQHKDKESACGEKGASEDNDDGAVSAKLTELFDSEIVAAIRAGNPVKLDPTIDRQKFRAQRDYLKYSCHPAYEFKSLEQTWYLEGTKP